MPLLTDSSPKHPTIIAFDHIPKCAGMSLQAAIKKTGITHYWLPNATVLLDVAERIASHHAGEPIFVSGHKAYGIHDLLPRHHVHYVTFLRHPAAIARSFYRSMRLRCRYQYGTFADFLRDYEWNMMTDQLGGSVPEALDRLEGYAFVGLVETYARDLARLSTLLGVRLDPDILENSSAPADAENALPLPDISGVTGNDVALYAAWLSRREATPPETAPTHRPAPGKRHMAPPVLTMAARQADVATVTGMAVSGDDHCDIFFVTSRRREMAHEPARFHRLLARYADEICDFIDPSAIDTDATFDALLALAHRLDAHLPIENPHSWITRQCQSVLTFLATTPQAARHDRSRELLEQAHALDPRHGPTAFQYAIWLRTHGQASQALSVLEGVRGATSFTKLLDKEYLATLHTAGGDAALTPYVQTHEKRLRHNLAGAGPVPSPSSDALLADGPLLIVRSGPAFVFHDLVDWVVASRRDMTLLVQDTFPIAARHAELPLLRLPAGMFNPHVAFPDRATLLRRPFATVLYATTDFFSLDGLSNFLLFFQQAPSHRSRAYPMANIVLPPAQKILLACDGGANTGKTVGGKKEDGGTLF